MGRDKEKGVYIVCHKVPIINRTLSWNLHVLALASYAGYPKVSGYACAEVRALVFDVHILTVAVEALPCCYVPAAGAVGVC
jgi:hypothetical protein